jgi:hypothetical protein
MRAGAGDRPVAADAGHHPVSGHVSRLCDWPRRLLHDCLERWGTRWHDSRVGLVCRRMLLLCVHGNVRRSASIAGPAWGGAAGTEAIQAVCLRARRGASPHY